TSTLEKFTTFGDLLRYLRRRVGLTQMDLAETVGYSDSQISRLEQNLRLPDIPTIQSLFVPALGLEEEPKAVARLLALAANVRREDAPGSGLCPYKGLNFFDEADADLFVGREALTTKLMSRVLLLESISSSDCVRFLAVVGASGSGKSSLVRAGLVSSLRWNQQSAEWQIHVLTPAAHPLEGLADLFLEAEADSLVKAMLKEPAGLSNFLKERSHLRRQMPLLFVVDQFEEIFTLCHSEEERTSFIDNLLTAASDPGSQVIVLITLRADFYAHCADYFQLREALAQNQEYIGAMSLDELQRAIEEPAQRGRWEMEPGLVDLLLRDVGQEPGALPLLSHALLETWQRRRGRTMTLSGYASSGGVRGAIAETAETVFTDQFTDEQKTIARRIFLRLTELNDETALADTRRRATFQELILKPEDAVPTHAVLKSLADARLITTSHDTAEVAHEALIREWPTLRGWLEENREGLRLHRQLTEAAQEWQSLGCEPDLLYRGVRLAQIHEWSRWHQDDLNSLEHEFLIASMEQTEKESLAREEQRQRELDAAKRLAETERQRAEEQSRSAKNLRTRNRIITAVGGIAILLAVLVGLFGRQANQNAVSAAENAASALRAQATAQANADLAEKAQSNAEAQKRIAFARELAANADNNLKVDPERSILLALQSLQVTAPDRLTLPEAENALHRAIAASRIKKTIQANQGTIWTIAYSPDGTRLATGGVDKTVHIWDTSTYQNILSIPAHDLDVDSVSFSPDGKRIATSSDDGTAKIWDAGDGRLLLILENGRDPVPVVQFSPDGSQLVTLSADKTIRFWDASSGDLLNSWNDLDDPGYQLQYTPDGRQVLYIDAGQLHIRDIQSGKDTSVIRSDAGIGLFAVSSDGRRLLILDDFLRLIDAASGQVLYNVVPPPNQVEHLAFSPDGSRIALAGRDGLVTLLDAASGVQLLQLAGHNKFIFRFAFRPEGKELASADQDGTVKIWSLEAGREVLTIPVDGNGRMALSPDGRLIATVSADLLNVYDSANGRIVFEKQIPDAGMTALAFSPNGTELATGGSDYMVRIWNTTSGDTAQEIQIDEANVRAIAYHPSGKTFAVAGLDGIISVFDSRDQRKILSWDAKAGQITALSYSPDGAYLGVGTADINDVKIFEAATGKIARSLQGHTGNPLSIAYSSDGTRLVTSGRDFTAKIWDAASGKEQIILRGHTSTVTSARFSPDGTLIATSSRDGTIRLWDAHTGAEKLTLDLDGGAHNVEFTPDGENLITWDQEGIKVFTLNVDSLIQIARRRLERSWTLEECQKYLHVDACLSLP
ncbi:MAG: PQQ-binding-like beta-propeller repeat protein, partial [Bacteroidota bacterium]